MKVYLVGGAVRDSLLDRPVHERDWVVVGATPEEMTARGFRPVGRDFPVFLHPDTHEEYALARLERKTGPGYRGFITEFSPEVTLEQDLLRRDLTINAMAQSEDGTLVDPYGGQDDLRRRLLRHVSPAFAEDPVRILRVARFLARYAPLGFKVAPETLDVMRTMVTAGEVDALVPERIWRELDRALSEPQPRAAIELLRHCGALQVIMPEVDALFGVPQPPEWHPEIDTGEHTLLTLQVAAARGASTPIRFALLMHDLGKALTPKEQWPRHRGHEQLGVRAIDDLCTRLRVPLDYRELAVLTSRYHTHVHRGLELRATTILELLEQSDAFRRPERFADFLEVCECDARGRLGLQDRPYPQRARLESAWSAARAVVFGDRERAGLEGPQIGERLRRLRLAAVQQIVD
ncbi:MAG: multifunctional CCA addition/repair protein [Gammaproteobacteria bacterium]|nr:multifunctional CCA addition/repair protein [Gammaproteobacteria bacterium]